MRELRLDCTWPDALAAAFAAVITGVLLWLVTNVAPRDWPAPPVMPVTVDGEHYRVGPAELEWLESFSELHFTAGEQAAREIVAAEIDARLDAIFADARARVPQFADWYYSLRGEYTRLAMAALSFAHLAEPDYVARHAAAILFPDDAWESGLAALQGAAGAALAAHQERVRSGWLAEVTRRLSDRRVPPPLPGAATDAPVDLDRLLQDLAARERAAFTTRVSVSTVAAAGAAAAGSAAARAARTGRLAARGAGRGAARVGAAAAGGATVCAPSGPGAVACALVAGAAVWLGTDWALLSLDEHFNRDELVAALEGSLEELRAQVALALEESYDRLIAERYGAARREIRKEFVPAEAGARVGH
ncbi:MAG TPA: hypothetical protein VIN61_05035 [Gammaproteobacteria bacterium]